MDSPNRSLLTSGEAADMLGVDRRTLIRMEKAGTLHPVLIYPKAKRRYRRDDIESILAGGSAA